MEPPLTISQAAEMEVAWRAAQNARAAKRALHGQPHASAGKTHRTVGSETRTAIFSLFDPVIEPGDYGRWLHRIPRSGASAQAQVQPSVDKRPT